MLTLPALSLGRLDAVSDPPNIWPGHAPLLVIDVREPDRAAEKVNSAPHRVPQLRLEESDHPVDSSTDVRRERDRWRLQLNNYRAILAHIEGFWLRPSNRPRDPSPGRVTSNNPARSKVK